MNPVNEALKQAKSYTELAEIRSHLGGWSLAPRQCEDLEELLNSFHELLTPLDDAVHRALRANSENVSENRVKEIVLADLERYARRARVMTVHLTRIANYHQALFDRLHVEWSRSEVLSSAPIC